MSLPARGGGVVRTWIPGPGLCPPSPKMHLADGVQAGSGKQNAFFRTNLCGGGISVACDVIISHCGCLGPVAAIGRLHQVFFQKLCRAPFVQKPGRGGATPPQPSGRTLGQFRSCSACPDTDLTPPLSPSGSERLFGCCLVTVPMFACNTMCLVGMVSDRDVFLNVL